MNFSSICRTCLSTDYLSPIFRNVEDHVRYTTAVYIATGLKVKLNDGLPQHICKNCIKLLNDSLNFRKQCKDVETHLLDTKIRRKNKEIKTEDVKVIYTISTKKIKFQDQSIYQQSTNIKTESNSDHNDAVPSRTERQDNKRDNDSEADTKNTYIKKGIDTDNVEKEYIESEDVKYEEEFLESSSELDNEYLSINEEEIEDTKEDVTSSPEPVRVRVNNIEYYDANAPYIKLNSKRVRCKFCNMNLSKRSIDVHMAAKHPGADTRRSKCDLCDKYIIRDRMDRHKIQMHGYDSTRCGYCKTEFDSKDLLLDHVKTCTAKTKRLDAAALEKRKSNLVECDICHKVMQKMSINLHKRVTHAGMGPVCEHCGRTFASNFRLGEHLRAKHGYEKFKCSMCDFRSATMLSIRNHERRHRGEKPFVCETCGAKFHAYYLLFQHKQSHRTQRVKKCDKCPASFKAGNTLHMHKLRCHNSRIYQCPMCPRTYGCRHYAVKHLRSVHRYSGPIGDCKVGEEDEQSIVCIAYMEKNELYNKMDED